MATIRSDLPWALAARFNRHGQPTASGSPSELATGSSSATLRSLRLCAFGATAAVLRSLTDGKVHSGFPSYSADGTEIVYRVWGESNYGLRILNIETRAIRTLTTGYDNLPGWSPDGSRVLFTRKVDDVNFDIFTIRPDGSDLLRVTSHRSGDGHAVWTWDGHIMWSSGMYGFRDEAALYDNTFQQYGQILIMNANGSEKRMLTDSRWEDSMPLLIPAKFL